MTDDHLSRLASWLLNTIGKALALAMGVTVLMAVIAFATQEPWLLWVAGVLSPLMFASVLYNASAPLPDDQ